MRGYDPTLSESYARLEENLDHARTLLKSVAWALEEHVKLVDSRLAERDSRIADLEQELSHARA
jgi:hypothetical protein